MCLQSDGFDAMDALQKMPVHVTNLTHDVGEIALSADTKIPSTTQYHAQIKQFDESAAISDTLISDLNKNKDASFLALNIALILVLLLVVIIMIAVMCQKEYKNIEILLSQLY